ncbi:MAG: AsnC family transcriptional regulator [Methanotrichaceae archaeon]|nr:AsnC family transcriptional regulator [Methanotrichaceae archaeon]
MDDLDRRLLKACENGIPLQPRPYKLVGEELGISEDEVIARLRALIDSGVLRRFSASIGHLALGIVANAMIAWRAPEDGLDRLGRALARFPSVTHCYSRETANGWPYNLYTMVHSRSKEDCLQMAEEMARRVGIDDYQVLFSEREFKKTNARI